MLYALGIPGVGFVNAEKLAEHFGTMDELLAATPEQIEEAEGIGPILAEQIFEELSEERDAGADRASAARRGCGWSSTPPSAASRAGRWRARRSC